MSKIITVTGVKFDLSDSRDPVYRAIDSAVTNMASEAKSIETGKRFAAKNDRFHDPPAPFSGLLTVKGKFGFVRDIIDKKVDHAITELVLRAQSDNPNMKQKDVAQHFLDTAGGELSLRELFKRAMNDRLSMGPGLVEATRIAKKAMPASLKHAPAYTFRKGQNGLWAQAVRIQKEDLSGFDDKKIWFQPFGSADKGKVTRNPDGSLKAWRFINSDTGQPMPDDFTKKRFAQSANELKVFYGYDSCSPHYGLPDFYGASPYLKIIELITDRFEHRLERPIAAQLLLVDSDGDTDEEGNNLDILKAIEVLKDIADKGTADIGVFAVKPGEGNRKGMDTVDLSSGLSVQELDRILIFCIKMVLVTMGTPASVANMVFEKIGAINADTGQWQMKNWRDTELEPIRLAIQEFLNALLRELGVTDWAVEFTPMQKAPEDKKLQAECDEIDIRSGVKTVAEVREERGLSKADTEAGSKEKEGEPKSKADGEKPAQSQKGENEEPKQTPKEADTEKSGRARPGPATRAIADDDWAGASADELIELDAELEDERSNMAAVLIGLLIALPGAGADVRTADAVIQGVADKIVSAGIDNIPAALERHKAQVEKMFGVTLTDIDLAEIAGAAKQRWETVVRDRWLGSRQSIERLIEQVGSDDPQALAEAAEGWQEKTFKKRLLLAAGAALVLEELRLSAIHAAQSIAREASTRPVERMRSQAALGMGEKRPEDLVEWRTRSWSPCEDCIELEAITAGGIKPGEMPTSPGDGDTRCRHNCHCIVVPLGAAVEQQTEEEYLAHQADLVEAARFRKRLAKEMTDLYNTDIEAYTAAQKAYADELISTLKGKG